MTDKTIFVKTIHVESKTRVRALPNQTFDTGEPIETGMNISCDKAVRGNYSIGTIFACALTPGKTFYSVTDKILRPTADASGAILKEALPEDADAYRVYIGDEPEETITLKTTPRVAPKLFDRIKSGSYMDKVLKCPTIEDNGFYVDKDIWHLVARNAIRKKNTMFVGPTGTGKTELVSNIAEAMGCVLHIQDMGTMTDPQSALLGVHRLEGHESIFDYANFAKDIQSPCHILLDELSRAKIDGNNILFPALDNRRMLPVGIASSKAMRAIPIHEEVQFWATANVGAEYTGTMSIDRALLDRFQIVELDYLPQDVEIKVLCRRTECELRDATIITAVAKAIRILAKKEELSTSISHRHTLWAAELTRDGMPVKRAIDLMFLPLFEGSLEVRDSEKSIAKAAMASM